MSDVAGGRDAFVPSVTDTTGFAPGGFARIPAKVLPWVVCALLAVPVAALYGRALDAPFICDDYPAVVENASIRKLWPLLSVSPGETPLSAPQQYPTAGRPLVNLSLALNYAIGGLNPVGYHVFNIIAHILASVLLWAIVRRTLRLGYFQGRFDRVSEPLAFLVALVWALHPLQIEAVQYVTQRTELMMGLFYLATMYACIRYFTATSPGQRTAWCVLATAACLSGMACKEVMVTAPVMALLFERTFIAGSFRKALETSWRLYLGLALGWGLLLVLNYGGPRSDTAGFDAFVAHSEIPLYAWWLTQAKALEMYLTLAFWPWPLVIHYAFFFDTLRAVLIPLLIVAVLGLYTVVNLWQRTATGFLGAWVFIILSPTLVVPIATEIAAERRMYVPLAAIVALVIVGGYALLQDAAVRRKSQKRAQSVAPWSLAITTIFALLAAGVFAIVGARRLTAFESPLALWQDTVLHQPTSFIALGNLGRQLILEGREQEATEYFERAVELNPAKAQSSWGRLLIRVGKPRKAIEHIEEAIRLLPDEAPELRYELGVSLIEAGQLPEGIKQLAEVVRLEPNSAYYQRNLGAALFNAGRPQEAIKHLKRALALEPGSTETQQFLALAVNDSRRSNEAINRLRKSVQNAPESARLRSKLGTALLDADRVDEAIEEFQQALRLQPDFADAKQGLQQALEAKKR
jgi:protein O-mannosyl-transferase